MAQACLANTHHGTSRKREFSDERQHFGDDPQTVCGHPQSRFCAGTNEFKGEVMHVVTCFLATIGKCMECHPLYMYDGDCALWRIDELVSKLVSELTDE